MLTAGRRGSTRNGGKRSRVVKLTRGSTAHKGERESYRRGSYGSLKESRYLVQEKQTDVEEFLHCDDGGAVVVVVVNFARYMWHGSLARRPVLCV